jgi:hypothetical protein
MGRGGGAESKEGGVAIGCGGHEVDAQWGRERKVDVRTDARRTGKTSTKFFFFTSYFLF